MFSLLLDRNKTAIMWNITENYVVFDFEEEWYWVLTQIFKEFNPRIIFIIYENKKIIYNPIGFEKISIFNLSFWLFLNW